MRNERYGYKGYSEPFKEMFVNFFGGVGEGMGLIDRRGRSKVVPRDDISLYGRRSDVDELICPGGRIRSGGRGRGLGVGRGRR